MEPKYSTHQIRGIVLLLICLACLSVKNLWAAEDSGNYLAKAQPKASISGTQQALP
jgi:hypothetical protein